MAKGQMRTTKEKKKPKSADKKDNVPKYMRTTELTSSVKPGQGQPGQKK